MSFLICKDAAFLQPTQIRPRKSFHIFPTHRNMGEGLRRRAYVLPCRRNRTLLSINIENTAEDNSDDSFQELASDISGYLKTCPESESSPLAYITLRKAGRLDLISRIMDAGGYIKVSTILGVRVDQSQFIPPSVSPSSTEQLPHATDDHNPSLALGRDLEARLNTIEDVMKNDRDRTDTRKRTTPNVPVADDVPTGEQLRLQNDTIRPAVIKQPIPVGERFTLTTAMRIGMLSLAVVSAIGLGRSSHDVVSDNITTVCRSLAYGLLFAHFVLGLYAGAILAPQKRRNPSLWFAKVLLGGPLGIRYLRALDVLPD